MVDGKVLAAKKIFHLGFYYSWALMGENKQRSRQGAIQINWKKHHCFESIHTVKIPASVLCPCVYFQWLCCSFGSLLKWMWLANSNLLAQEFLWPLLGLSILLCSSSGVRYPECLHSEAVWSLFMVNEMMLTVWLCVYHRSSKVSRSVVSSCNLFETRISCCGQDVH